MHRLVIILLIHGRVDKLGHQVVDKSIKRATYSWMHKLIGAQIDGSID
jgi:hypothetical protein